MIETFGANRSLSTEARLRQIEDAFGEFSSSVAQSLASLSQTGQAADTLGGGQQSVIVSGGGGGGGGSPSSLAGDVVGSPGSTTVVALQHQPVTAGTVTGQLLDYDGAGWTPTVIVLVGDVSGAYNANTVDKVKNQAVAAGTTTDQIWVFNGTSWLVRKYLAALGIGTGADPVSLLDVGAGGTARAAVRVTSGAAPTSPNEGDLWTDSTRKAWQTQIDGIKQTIPGILYVSTANGQVTNTTTETTLIGSGVGTLTLPANFFVAGKTLRFTAAGIFSTQLVPVGLDIKFKLGSTVIIATGAQVPSGATTNRFWWLDVLLTCRTTGGAGTVIAQGTFAHGEVAGVATFTWEMTSTATTTIDTTASQVVDATATWSAGVSASDDIRSTNTVLGAEN